MAKGTRHYKSMPSQGCQTNEEIGRHEEAPQGVSRRRYGNDEATTKPIQVLSKGAQRPHTKVMGLSGGGCYDPTKRSSLREDWSKTPLPQQGGSQDNRSMDAPRGLVHAPNPICTPGPMQVACLPA
ncbi:unnamed protein product [Citrullus colocynthis]|uniref:Uncharacterized protein n=1 Tax=Citrullus colocynthis TaxID=252529 RepID=A0ABP0Y4Z9_9ROSI